MSASKPYTYHGTWINWSRGRVYGATITLSAQDGGLLIAFLALYVAVTTSRLWRIVSYAVYQARARRTPQDGLRLQTQATFRNASSAISAAWNLLLIAFHWRLLARRPFLRSLLWAVFALAYALAAGLATIFSSEVTKAVGTEVLIRSPRCGFWLSDDERHFGMWSHPENLAAADYAQTCYYGDPDQARLQCNNYVVPGVEFSVNSNASCPFGGDMCMISPTAAFEMDTGQMSSHSIFGINGPMSARVDFRKISTCAPLVSKGFMDYRNNTGKAYEIGQPGDLVLRLFYGPSTIQGNNITMQYNSRMMTGHVGYSLWYVSADLAFSST
ncbi:MAG: hypothetical protein M1815_002652 [Lichina confinis]|nr:MAG: hypothetical protein M1815_002652 [Lichina confinis]